MAQTKKTKKEMMESRDALQATITSLEAKALAEPLSDADQAELTKAKAQLTLIQDQIDTMEKSSTSEDPLEVEKQKLEAEKAAIEAERQKLEAEKSERQSLLGPTKETYKVPEAEKGLLHLKVSKGATFDPKSGKPLGNWKVITLSLSEWTNLKRCIGYYDYTITDVLHDPFGDVEEFLQENNALHPIEK